MKKQIKLNVNCGGHIQYGFRTTLGTWVRRICLPRIPAHLTAISRRRSMLPNECAAAPSCEGP